MKNMISFFDLDSTLADSLPIFLYEVAKDLGVPTPHPNKVKDYYAIQEAFTGLIEENTFSEAFQNAILSEKICKAIPIYENAVRAVNEILKFSEFGGYITARDNNLCTPSVWWAEKNNLPFSNEVYCSADKIKTINEIVEKKNFTGKIVLWDDHPKHIKKATENNFYGVLVSQPYNMDYENKYRISPNWNIKTLRNILCEISNE